MMDNDKYLNWQHSMYDVGQYERKNRAIIKQV